MTEYQKFIESKRHSKNEFGITPNFIPDNLFDYQKYVVEVLVKKGRGAGFLQTGTGKTLVEMVTATNYVRHTNKPVLIMTPLAVAFQFIAEAEKFGIDDIEYSKDGKFTKKIVVCNYERLHKFDPLDFDCVILDESSILKNFEGATKNDITTFLKKIKYRYLFTATPSPNDFVELGTSSEALGYLGYTDMLTRFFTNKEKTIKAQGIGTEWALKGHAKESFFNWVSTWSISMRTPSDLGYSDEGYELPPLIVNDHVIRNETPLTIGGQTALFAQVAKSLKEIRSESSVTKDQRCEKAVELAKSHETSVYWCNLNAEGDLLQKLDKSAHQIKGSMSIDQKEEMLLAFAKGQIKKLITKPSMTAFGLNWQHCYHTIYFPTFSFEQYYQSIKRFHRFGQKNEVIVDRVFTDGQVRLLESLNEKGVKSDSLYSKLNSSLNSSYEFKAKGFDKPFISPIFKF